MNYFQYLFGFAEAAYPTTREHLFRRCRFENGPLGRERCVFAGRGWDAGWFYTPSVTELRSEVAQAVADFRTRHPGYLEALKRRDVQEQRVTGITHVVGESKEQHQLYGGALFQAASQFNLLEFVSSTVTPEEGIADYVYDRTQGPACALACFPGTAYRNYLIHPRFFQSGSAAATDASAEAAPVDVTRRGQQVDRQVNMLADLAALLAKAYPAIPETKLPALPAISVNSLFTIRNGYFLCNDEQKEVLNARLEQLQTRMPADAPQTAMQYLASALRIGIVEDTMVTAAFEEYGSGGCDKPLDPNYLPRVTQTYNSALSLAMPRVGVPARAGVETLAQTVLLGTYEATLLAGVLHTLRFYDRAIAQAATDTSAASQPGADAPLPTAPPIFLTKVGGGVFNNSPRWIRSAIAEAHASVSKYDVPMNVQLVHFRVIEKFYTSL